jgi:hypothetical protein
MTKYVSNNHYIWCIALLSWLCCVVSSKWYLMLTVSQAHIKHNLIVVVDGSWTFNLPLLVQSNKKLAWMGSIVKMLSNKQGCPNWTGPWLAWLMGSATLAFHIKHPLRFSWSINLSWGMHALMTSRAKGGIFILMNLRKIYLKLFEF